MNTRQLIGVIGAGSFGTTIAYLLAEYNDVLIYARRDALIRRINEGLPTIPEKKRKRIRATQNIEYMCEQCSLIFPVVPSKNFRGMMREFSPFLRPRHILIHCTKGFDVVGLDEEESVGSHALSHEHIRTMSQVILEESSVLRVGCMAGPNLAREILEGLPAASVIASEFDEVIKIGKENLNSRNFHVFGSHDILGAELAGALKNVIALGSGILQGKKLGKNIQAMLITRGLHEMIHIGQAMGSESSAFFGAAGIGDLIATATSSNSRNFSVGLKLGKGEKLSCIMANMDEVAEGVRTLKIAHRLCINYDVNAPVINMLYRILFEDLEVDQAIHFLMKYPATKDVDFI